MADQLQLRRGTSAENDAFTGAAGEVTVDTTNDSLRVHDGASAGGCELMRADGDNASIPLLGTQPGYMSLWADYKDASTVTVSAGKVMINGTLYTVSAAIDHTVSPSGDNWYWIMAAEPGTGSVLTATELSSTTTAPAYDAAKDGYYSADGLKRCIGFVLSASGSLQASRMLNGILSFNNAVQMYSTVSWPSSDTAITVGPPIRAALSLHVYLENDTGTNEDYNFIYLSNGDGGTSTRNTFGLSLAGSGITLNRLYAFVSRVTNDSGQLKTISTIGQTGNIDLCSVHLPGGFGR
jgi:hypothetical protein